MEQHQSLMQEQQNPGSKDSEAGDDNRNYVSEDPSARHDDENYMSEDPYGDNGSDMSEKIHERTRTFKVECKAQLATGEISPARHAGLKSKTCALSPEGHAHWGMQHDLLYQWGGVQMVTPAEFHAA